MTAYEAVPLAIPAEKLRFWNSLRSSIGCASDRSWRHEPDCQCGGDSEQNDDGRRRPAQRSPEGDGCEEGHHRRNEEREPLPVEALPSLQMLTARHEGDGRQCSENTQGDVYEKNEAPSARREKHAAQRRSEGQTNCLCRPLQADRTPERVPRDDEDDDRQAVGLQHGRADGLQGATPTQRGKVRSETTQKGSHDENDEAVDVQKLASPRVGQAAKCRHRGHENHQITQSDPGDRPEAGVERRLHRGEGDGDDAGVELAHERTDAHCSHGKPMSVGTFTDRRMSSRLNHEPAPAPLRAGTQFCPHAPILSGH